LTKRQRTGAGRLPDQVEQTTVQDRLVRPQPGQVHHEAELLDVVVVEAPHVGGRFRDLEESRVRVHGSKLRRRRRASRRCVRAISARP